MRVHFLGCRLLVDGTCCWDKLDLCKGARGHTLNAQRSTLNSEKVESGEWTVAPPGPVRSAVRVTKGVHIAMGLIGIRIPHGASASYSAPPSGESTLDLGIPTYSLSGLRYRWDMAFGMGSRPSFKLALIPRFTHKRERASVSPYYAYLRYVATPFMITKTLGMGKAKAEASRTVKLTYAQAPLCLSLRGNRNLGK